MSNQSNARTVTGVVVSDARDKTISVKVARKVVHPKYKKYIRKSSKFHAHDAENKAKAGDTVIIKECAPISKSKTWVLLEIVSSAQ